MLGRTLYALASLRALAAEVSAYSSHSLLVSGSTPGWPSVIQPSLQAWGRSSWWSWWQRWGCGTLVVSTAFPLFCGPGPGVVSTCGAILYPESIFQGQYFLS
jgi:hypothetical protein